MREFMDYVQSAFYQATNWNRESSYSSLNNAANSLLDFSTPRGLRLTLSSLASPNFATSYQLSSVGVVDGSISYLYSSVPLQAHLQPQSDRLPLPTLLQSYKPLPELAHRDDDNGPYPISSPAAASLCYGRLYLPQSLLEALLIKRVSPALQLQLSAVSGQFLRNGGTLLGLAQYDVGRYALEGLASSDGGLLGFRGIFNFGGDAEDILPLRAAGVLGNGGTGDDRIYGRFSTGGEIYYGTLNKSGGVSLGARFATLPSHRGTPLTATLTLNPLMGNISATYALMAGRNCSLATKFDFNVFSYESDWAIGTELWRKRHVRDAMDPVLSTENTVSKGSSHGRLAGQAGSPESLQSQLPLSLPHERSFQAKLEWRLDEPGDNVGLPRPENTDDEYTGVIKARLDQNLRIGVLWEGRAKSLLFSLGSSIDLRKLDSPFRTVGVEVQFSS